MKEILLVGGGGHCRSCIDLLEATGKFQIVGVVQPANESKATVFQYPVIGGDDDLPHLLRETPSALVTVGQILSVLTRKKLFRVLKDHEADLPIVISPFSRVSPRASLGIGTVVLHGAVVNAGAEIGQNCIINSQSLIEHDARIGSHCHISTGAAVNGACIVENECFIGSGAVLREAITIGFGSVIGAGSVVTESVPAGSFIRPPQAQITEKKA